jgi:hypothetical protein
LPSKYNVLTSISSTTKNPTNTYHNINIINIIIELLLYSTISVAREIAVKRILTLKELSFVFVSVVVREGNGLRKANKNFLDNDKCYKIDLILKNGVGLLDWMDR